uniref:Glycoprotein L n=1 Tax=Anatid alphaherpesvirus 2 TaxID=3080522 RepID=A0AAU0K869_9ALPH
MLDMKRRPVGGVWFLRVYSTIVVYAVCVLAVPASVTPPEIDDDVAMTHTRRPSPFRHEMFLETGTLKAPTVESVLRLRCIPQDLVMTMRYAAVPVEGEKLPTGILVKGHCNIPEFILWYEGPGTAAWVSPVVAASALLDDVWKAGFSRRLQAEIFEDMSLVFGSESFFTTVPRGKGCLNPENPADLECHGAQNRERFEAEDVDDSRGETCGLKAAPPGTWGASR